MNVQREARGSWSALRSWQFVAGGRVRERQTKTFIVATSLVAMQLAVAGLSDLSAGTLWPGMAKLVLAALVPLSWRSFERGRRPVAVLISGGIGLVASCAGSRSTASTLRSPAPG